MSSRVDVKVDLRGLEARLGEGSLREKQAAFAERVAFETRDYVPVESGTLQGSEPVSSDYEGGTVEWNTPYAAIVEEMPESSIRKTINPNARAHWPQAAKSERLGAWQDFARKLMEG